jgi:hypothetical protein
MEGVYSPERVEKEVALRLAEMERLAKEADEMVVKETTRIYQLVVPKFNTFLVSYKLGEAFQPLEIRVEFAEAITRGVQEAILTRVVTQLEGDVQKHRFDVSWRGYQYTNQREYWIRIYPIIPPTKTRFFCRRRV